MSLEVVVRPAATKNVFATRQVAAEPSSQEEAVIEWGAGTSQEIAQNTIIHDYGDQADYEEVGRDVETVRVENPDDSSQYVMVERIKAIRFSAPKGVYTFKLNP